MESKKKSHLKKVIFLMILIFIIGFFATLTIYNTFYLIAFRTIDMKVTVSEEIGLSSGKDILDFGSAPPGATIVKSVEIDNTRPHNVKASIKVTGNISNLTILTENEIVIGPMESHETNFTVNIPFSAASGDYSGKAQIFIKRT